MRKILAAISSALISLALFANPAFAVASFFNGFESDMAGWLSNGGTITRVVSGTNVIPSADGDYHAEVIVSADFNGAYTQWGGYETSFPVDGYVTQLDVYLDMSQNPTVGTDKRFDYSSAINNAAGSHRRDFIFSVGTDPLVAGQFAMSASNNAPGWPSNPGRNPFYLNTSGWYTFRHTFQNDGSGVLEVVMELLDSSGNSLHSWTLSDPTDIIGSTVGGNRYGWFVTSDFPFLAVDNSEKYNIVPVIGPPTNKDDCKKEVWKTFNNPTFKNQGACVSYIQSNEHAQKRLQTFSATDSFYYNGLSASDGLYASGPISFTWDAVLGNVTGGYWNEVHPATTGTTYYNIVTSGAVTGSNVSLTFDRTNPDVNHFTFTGTLVEGVLTGQMAGPYLFTAVGN